ncbi:MAG TPA: hypothetical protein VFK13_04430 [Gemmatimonadaceae bacterium]|nr:hypothetical protein [Gemmatimonadaceae bacterium]
MEDLRWRLPNIYGLPVPIESCWIAYVTGWWDGLYSSRVILIERDSGSVVYDGSAHDEG